MRERNVVLSVIDGRGRDIGEEPPLKAFLLAALIAAFFGACGAPPGPQPQTGGDDDPALDDSEPEEAGPGSAPSEESASESATRPEIPTVTEVVVVQTSRPAPSEAGCDSDGDQDGDGVLDCEDVCPEAAEDIDEDRDDDGCPERSIGDAPTMGR